MRMTLAILATVTILSPIAAADQLTVPDEYETIQDAIDASSNGDLILVGPGTYMESIDFRGKAVAVRSFSGADETVIDGSQAGSSVVHFWNFEGQDSILDGFTITGGSGSNSAGMQRGGGIFVQSSSPTIRNCRIKGNQAGAGGGVAAWTASPWLFDCVIEDNSAYASGTGGGAGLHAYSSFPRLVNVEFRNNVGSGFAAGGAIALHELSDAQIVNCLLINNSGRHSGGVYNMNSTVEVCNSTFSKNHATNSSGGEALYNVGPSAEGVALNCIFWNNGESGEGDEIVSILGSLVVLNSCVEGGYEGEGNIDVDPLFVDPDADDYHLKLASPLVDAGNNDFLPADITEDLGHEPRFADPDNPEIVEPNVDLGPYEVQPDPSATCPGDVDGDRFIGLTDLLTVIGEWGTCESSTGCVGDTNGDGFIDLVDLLTIIGGWGECS